MSVNDVMPPPAVALLARPGTARERLREALALAGTELVLEEDPQVLAPEVLLACSPHAVVVALEPAVEDALERLEEALSSPDFVLVFDEAEVAARREGWEMQRWARHLAAKLHGRRNVLPPGAEEEDELLPEPGLSDAARVPETSEPLSFHLNEAADAAHAVPGDSMFHEPLPEPETEPAQPVSTLLADHSTWALLDDDVVHAAPATVAGTPGVSSSFESTALSLVDIEPAAAPRHGARGAVVVLAGIGGPDALRRLLGALPAQLDVPVLVRMPLDGARYGNLVKQMARVSALPVALAEADADVLEGHVYILPDDTAVDLRDGRLHFQVQAGGLDLATLPAPESAVILLSGAGLAQVEPALALAEAGAWVGGQVGEGCYDPAAATAVVAAGRFAGEPQELAQAIGARWAPAAQGDGQ